MKNSTIIRVEQSLVRAPNPSPTLATVLAVGAVRPYRGRSEVAGTDSQCDRQSAQPPVLSLYELVIVSSLALPPGTLPLRCGRGSLTASTPA